MPEIRYTDLDAYLAKTRDNELVSIYLVHGDEYLCRNAADRLIQKILPENDRNVAFETFDGDNENIVRAIDHLNTYSLFSDKKVAAIRDSRIFYSQQESDRIYEKARQAFLDQDIEKACAYFVAFMALSNLDFEDLEGENRYKVIKSDESDADDEKWLNQVIEHCIEKKIAVPSGQNIADRLAGIVEKGFPKGNRLIMTTDFVDKRRLLYKAIKDNGVIIDCSVPKGARKADKDAQNALLHESLRAILTRHGKTIDPGAITLLIEKTGFDLRTFTTNIEKLIDFAGKRGRITTEDINSVLNRTKIDPIFELTNAVSDRNPEKSLFFLNSLLSSDTHPLQVLAALVNQFRKLVLARSFLDTYRQSVRPNMNLNEFKLKILPVVSQADNALIEEIERWNDAFGLEDGDEAGDLKTKKTKARKIFSTELAIAKNPNNLYPIMQILRQAGNFSARELAMAITRLHQADRRMKTSPLDAKLVVEKAIVDILG